MRRNNPGMFARALGRPTLMWCCASTTKTALARTHAGTLKVWETAGRALMFRGQESTPKTTMPGTMWLSR